MKVLIISHNPISTYQNMGKTILSLFESFDCEELCQLYIYPSIPDVKKCNSYFRITDKDIIRSFYQFSVDGKEIIPNKNIHNKFTNERDVKIYSNKNNKKSSRKLIRDVLWKCSRWYNKPLKSWLNKENPECIFLAPGDAKFIYDIALKISKKKNIPIVTYICDDYYFVEKPNNIIAKIQLASLQKKIRKLLKKTSHVITICDDLRDAYSKNFNVSATTIMTGSNHPIANCPIYKEPQSITYMGNVGLNRYVSITELGMALDEINLQYKTNYSLKIYTSANDSEILDEFKKANSISLCGYVSGENFEKVFYSSELLLHTEGFDDNSIDRVKASISTKIADSLGSGIPLIAYGPDSVASMKHLINNNCAIIITKKEYLKDTLLKAFNDENFRSDVVQNALRVANDYHFAQTNSKRLYEILLKVRID